MCGWQGPEVGKMVVLILKRKAYRDAFGLLNEGKFAADTFIQHHRAV